MGKKAKDIAKQWDDYVRLSWSEYGFEYHYENYAMEPESPEFESALAEAEDQMLQDCATEEWP